MKAPRPVFMFLGAFALGYVTHLFVVERRVEGRRAGLEAYYRGIVSVGDDLDKVTASLKETGLSLASTPYVGKYHARLTDPRAGFGIWIEVDEKRKVQKVSVGTLIIK